VRYPRVVGRVGKGQWWAMLLGALFLSACSSVERIPASEVPPVQDGNHGGTPVSHDACPGADERSGRWDLDGDGCPDSVSGLLAFASADIGSFWSSEMLRHGLPYTPPSLIPLETPSETPCSPARPARAFYCPEDGGIYYDVPFMQRQLGAAGAYGPVLVLAHEWARVIQHQVRMPEAGLTESEIELQAGCFAGAYLRASRARDTYDPRGPGPAAELVFGAGEDGELAWSPSGPVASPDDRVAAFHTGLERGLDACLE
jgi:hypothetical protein